MEARFGTWGLVAMWMGFGGQLNGLGVVGSRARTDKKVSAESIEGFTERCLALRGFADEGL